MPEIKSIGDDLKKRVEGPGDRKIIDNSRRSRPERTKRSVLLNLSRRRIFEYFTRYPCSRLEKTSRSLGIPSSTVKWHIQKLRGSGFLEYAQVHKKNVYFAPDTTDVNDIEVLSALNDGKVRSVLSSIVENEEANQVELARKTGMSPQMIIWYTDVLQEQGIIENVSDGRSIRYVLSGLLEELGAKYGSRSDRFKKSILERLSHDALRPEVYRSVPGEISIQIGLGRNRALLVICLNPFEFD